MPITGVWAETWLGGQVRCFAPEAKTSLAFESPAAEQNMPDSGYAAVHTGVNHKAFCKQKFTAITMSCSPSEMTFITLFVQLV